MYKKNITVFTPKSKKKNSRYIYPTLALQSP